MNIRLLVVSKTDIPYIQEGIDVYVKRLKHYVNFELEVIPALKDQKGASPDEIKEREGALILKRLELHLITKHQVLTQGIGLALCS